MTTLEDYLEYDARLYPNKTAIVCGVETCSYHQLYERTKARSRDFSGKRHQIVPLRATPTIDFMVDYFALHMARAIVAPMEKDLPQQMMDDMEEMLSAESAPEGTADVLFTTGTTGRSKGVIISHRAIIADAENLIAGQGFSHDLTFIINGPLNHIGSLSKVYPVVLLGATICIIDGMKDLNAFFRSLDNTTKTASFFVPATLRILLHFAADQLAKYANKIDFIECGGAPLPHTDMQALCTVLPHSRLYNTYASTETGIISTYNFNDGQCLAGCLGKPMPHSRIIITAEGIIACQGDTLMSGYLGDPKLTNDVLRDDTVYMADMGHLDKEGRLHIDGRLDDVINVGGYKVAPSEVEDQAMTLATIKDCICIAVPHPITGQALKLLVVMTEGQKLEKRVLALHLKQRLETYKVPLLYEQVTAIERTYNGKLNRKFYKQL